MEPLPPLPEGPSETSCQPPLPPNSVSQVVENDWDSAKGEGTEIIVQKSENKRHHPEETFDEEIDLPLSFKRPCLDTNVADLNAEPTAHMEDDSENQPGSLSHEMLHCLYDSDTFKS